MRVLCAAAMAALLAGPAFAQGKGGGKDPPPAKTQTEIDADRAAETAYKKSLGNIPDQAPADPWGGARSLEAPKAADKPTKKKPPA
jgi:hypothetical protein